MVETSHIDTANETASSSQARQSVIDILAVNFYLIQQSFNMSEDHMDEFDHYNYDQEKHVRTGNSGKQRTKLEQQQHSNHPDPSGHTRKIVTKLQNTEAGHKEKERKDSKN